MINEDGKNKWFSSKWIYTFAGIIFLFIASCVFYCTNSNNYKFFILSLLAVFIGIFFCFLKLVNRYPNFQYKLLLKNETGWFFIALFVNGLFSAFVYLFLETTNIYIIPGGKYACLNSLFLAVFSPPLVLGIIPKLKGMKEKGPNQQPFSDVLLWMNNVIEKEFEPVFIKEVFEIVKELKREHVSIDSLVRFAENYIKIRLNESDEIQKYSMKIVEYESQKNMTGIVQLLLKNLHCNPDYLKKYLI